MLCRVCGGEDSLVIGRIVENGGSAALSNKWLIGLVLEALNAQCIIVTTGCCQALLNGVEGRRFSDLILD